MSATSSASWASQAGPRRRSTRSNGSSSPATSEPAGGSGPDGSPGHRPAIVFVHATRLTGAQWASQVAELSADFDCFAPDLPGHGAAAGVPFTLASAAEGIAELIEREATDGRAVVVGLSLGAYVAMEVAARWPERVTGLVLAGATAEPRGARTPLFRALAGLYGLAPERWLVRGETWAFRRRYPATVTDPIIRDGFSHRAGSLAVRSIVGEAFRPRLARYPGPTLLVNGQRDLLFRIGARSFSAVAASPRRVVIHGAGHRSNLDRPGAFTAAVRAFASEVSGSAD
jgi:pimeloyl-ACP methyl ester carboxylesterase